MPHGTVPQYDRPRGCGNRNRFRFSFAVDWVPPQVMRTGYESRRARFFGKIITTKDRRGDNTVSWKRLLVTVHVGVNGEGFRRGPLDRRGHLANDKVRAQ